MKSDWLVVGAGLTGSTMAERIASQLGQRVLVIDRRPHVAGNAYDALDEHGTLVHRHGAHIFHTSSESVWRYLSHFTTWRPYEHRVLASIEGKLVPLPFNLNTIDALFSERQARQWTDLLLSEFAEGDRAPVLKLIDHPNRSLAALGRYVYDNVFLNYTEKQWGLRPEELDFAVTSRVPVLVGRDDRYFRDTYQGMPAQGYTVMVERMLSHPNITVALGTPYEEAARGTAAGKIIFTGPIDEFYGHVYGPLPYRSLRFDSVEVPSGPHQPVAVVNYPNEHQYTRVIEHSHFYGPRSGPSALTYEYPQPYVPGRNEPYYPLPTPASHKVYSRYAAAAESERDVMFAGRLACYRYYDMDQAVSRALQIFKRHIVDNQAVPVPA